MSALAPRPEKALPFELWERIYELAPKEEPCRLYSINQALFHIFLGSQYHHIHCDGPAHLGSPKRHIQALKDPSTSRYVKELTLWLQPLDRYLDRPKDCQEPQPERPTLLELCGPSADFSHLPSLHTFSMVASEDPAHYHSYHNFSETFSTPIRNALQGISQTLRSLNLTHVPLEFFRDDVISSTVHFPLLEDIRMDLFTIYHTTDYEAVLQHSVAPFINRHSQSLTSLEVSTRNARSCPRYFYKYARLFQHILHIPGLELLSVRAYLLQNDGGSLDELGRFIHSHSSTLTSLKLHLYHSSVSSVAAADRPLEFNTISQKHTPETLLGHHLFAEAVPSCRRLKGLDCMLLAEDALQLDPTPSLQWFRTFKAAETLTSLSLQHNTLQQADLISLVSTVDLSGLRKLQVLVQAFDMGLFDVLSSKLPELEDLSMSAFSLLCKLAAGIQTEWTPQSKLLHYSPFLQELRARSYPRWKSLRTLSIPILDKGYQLRQKQALPPPYDAMELPGVQSWIDYDQMRLVFPYIQHFDGEILPYGL